MIVYAICSDLNESPGLSRSFKSDPVIKYLGLQSSSTEGGNGFSVYLAQTRGLEAWVVFMDLPTAR